MTLYKKLTVLILSSIVSISNAQSYIPQNHLSIVVNISTYNFTNGVYQVYNPYPSYSMFDLMGKMLSNLQERYDYAHSILSREHFKLKNLDLINVTNKAVLDIRRNEILSYSNSNYKKVDFAIYNNFSSWLEFYTQIYEIPSIKNEMILLNGIDKEIRRIRQKDPDSFHRSERYKELGSVLAELQTIRADSIPSLSWKYGLF